MYFYCTTQYWFIRRKSVQVEIQIFSMYAFSSVGYFLVQFEIKTFYSICSVFNSFPYIFEYFLFQNGQMNYNILWRIAYEVLSETCFCFILYESSDLFL